MLIADAQIETERPSRYLAQVCSHIDNIYNPDRGPNQAVGQRDSSHIADDRHGRAKSPVHVEWSDTHGTVTSREFKITMHASPRELTLRAEAADPATLRRIQNLLAGLLDRFGRRDQLAVRWQPSRAQPVQPSD